MLVWVYIKKGKIYTTNSILLIVGYLSVISENSPARIILNRRGV